jgi:7-keto-8-aminopelargonate synthetase-like enzyme
VAALHKLEAEPERVSRLHERAALFLALCKEAGFDTGASAGTPVVPVIVGESVRAATLSAMLFDAGINVQPMVAPSVADDQARLRFFVASTHRETQLRAAVEATKRALGALDAALEHRRQAEASARP